MIPFVLGLGAAYLAYAAASGRAGPARVLGGRQRPDDQGKRHESLHGASRETLDTGLDRWGGEGVENVPTVHAAAETASFEASMPAPPTVTDPVTWRPYL